MFPSQSQDPNQTRSPWTEMFQMQDKRLHTDNHQQAHQNPATTDAQLTQRALSDIYYQGYGTSKEERD